MLLVIILVNYDRYIDIFLKEGIPWMKWQKKYFVNDTGHLYVPGGSVDFGVMRIYRAFSQVMKSYGIIRGVIFKSPTMSE